MPLPMGLQYGSKDTSPSAAAMLLGLVLALFLSVPVVLADTGLPNGSAKRAGFSPERLARIECFIDDEIEGAHIPGAIMMVARNGKVIHSVVSGYQDVESRKPVALDTIFRIYSMTKPVMGVATMILVEEGKLKLDDPVAKYIPEFGELEVYWFEERGEILTSPATETMTIHHLVTHTSGLTFPSNGDTPLHQLLKKEYVPANEFPSLGAFVERMAEFPLLFQPGTRYEYAPGFDVLGHVIEQVAGESLKEFLGERIFEPLGMVDTGFFVPAEKVGRFASTYTSTDDGLELIETGATSYLLDPNITPRGGGGLVSTAADYLRFAQMMLNGGELDGARILAPTTVRFMTRNHLPADEPRILNGFGHGIGFGVELDVARRQMLGNDGMFHWSGADRTHFWVDPKTGIIGLFLTQVRPFNFEYEKYIRNLTYQAFLE